MVSMNLHAKKAKPNLQDHPLNLCVGRDSRYVCINLSRPACIPLKIPVWAVLTDFKPEYQCDFNMHQAYRF